MPKLSIHRAYRGKHILLTGASGFLGKVWLSLMLDRIPEIEKIYVLIRRKRDTGAWERFEEIVATSYAFEPLHRRHGEALGAYLAERVEVVEGDVSLPDFGIDPEAAEDLTRKLDLIVHCAGLVDFEPDLREAVETNISGSLHAVDFAKRCQRAALVHVSTCYVVGDIREGMAPEALAPDYTPNGRPMDAEAEYEELLSFVKTASLKDSEWVDEARRRAAGYGWPNGYTYSKSLAESLIRKRAGDLKYSVVRPAVVESSMHYPFPGWNEGAQTCAPLSYLLGTWLRFFPINTRHVLDVIPVDYVCQAVTVAGAALMEGCASQVIQVGSSQRNPLRLDRMLELLNLAHRAHWRQSASPLERIFLSRWDSVAVSQDSPLGPESLRKTAAAVFEALRGLKERSPKAIHEYLNKALSSVNKAKWALVKTEKVVEVFAPFIYRTDFRFVTEALAKYQIEEEAFAAKPEDIDWRHYIMKVLEPGLRRWCYPVLEGKPVEKLSAPWGFRIPRGDRPGLRIAGRAR